MARGTQAPKKLIVGITGATGAAYGIGILKTLKALPAWESHLVLTDAGALKAVSVGTL